MKGPFATYEEALDAANDGECVMARNERYAPGASWCVMSDADATLTVASTMGKLSGWTHWENVRKPQLTVEQAQALDAFAKRHGPGWKTALLSAWSTGKDEGYENGHLLRQIRNDFGAVWLSNFKLENSNG